MVKKVPHNPVDPITIKLPMGGWHILAIASCFTPFFILLHYLFEGDK